MSYRERFIEVLMSDEREDLPKVLNIPKDRQRPKFVPMTGNPENGDYLDWYNHLRKGELVPFPKHKK